MRELDAAHVTSELHVGHHKHQTAAGTLQNELCGLGAFAFDDVDLAFFQQQAKHFPLHRIVFDNECGCTKGF